MENQPIAPATDQKQLLVVLNLFIGFLAVLCILFIFLIIVGYSTVQLVNLPPHSSVAINGHSITSSTIRLRPGSYQLIISSPTIDPFQQTVNIGLFQTVRYSPTTQSRDPNAIASSVIGAVNGTTTTPQISQVQFFENSTWMVGYISNGNATLALQYDSGKELWHVGYYNTSGYPNSLTSLPSDVAGYVEQLEAQHAN